MLINQMLINIGSLILLQLLLHLFTKILEGKNKGSLL